MGRAADDDLEAFKELLDESGENVSLDHSTVKVIIDRTAGERRMDKGQIDFGDSQEITKIEMLKTAVQRRPQIGMSALDQYGIYHRLEKVITETHSTYKFECVASRTP